MSDLIDREKVLNTVVGYFCELLGTETISEDSDLLYRLRNLPSAEPELLDDGTLIVTSNKYKDVKRVLVEDGKMFGSMFYANR